MLTTEKEKHIIERRRFVYTVSVDSRKLQMVGQGGGGRKRRPNGWIVLDEKIGAQTRASLNDFFSFVFELPRAAAAPQRNDNNVGWKICGKAMENENKEPNYK